MSVRVENENELMALNVSQAAARIGVSRPTMYELMNVDGFPVVKFGRRRLIPIKAFEEWLNSQANQKRCAL